MSDLIDCTQELSALYRELLPDDERKPYRRLENQASMPSGEVTDDELIAKARAAKNGSTFNALFTGNWKGSEYKSESEADLALCNLLAFWCGKDSERIDRLFRRSGLYRKKWEREDYRQRTISSAISGVRSTYNPSRGHSRGCRPQAHSAKQVEHVASNDPPEHSMEAGAVPPLRPGVPTVKVGGRQLRDESAEALSALQLANDPPVLYMRGGNIVEIVRDEHGRMVIREVGEAGLRRHLTRVANYVRDGKGCAPPLEIVRDIGSMPPEQLAFPPLVGLVDFPILRPDGSISIEAGYDPTTRLVYSSEDTFQIPEVPTSDHIDVARGMLDELFTDFPFVDEASAANARAAMLTAVMRPAIAGPVPLALLDAPQAGTGKSKIAELVAIVATGAPAEMYSPPISEEEFGKIITTILVGGNQVAVIDNVTRRLDSANLAKTLTETLHADRQFRTHTKIVLPVRCTWLVSGNNLRLGGDLPRRCFWVRLDARSSRPFLRTGFRHPDLIGWTKQHRCELVSGLLTMARAWFVAGKQAPNLIPLGSFEDWSISVGGVLEFCGIKGFLTNIDRLHQESDAEGSQWENFLLALQETFSDEPFGIGDLWERLHPVSQDQQRFDSPATVLRAVLPDFLAEGVGRGDGFFKKRCGRCFVEFAGRRFGESGAHLIRAGSDRKIKVQLWKVGVNGDL